MSRFEEILVRLLEDQELDEEQSYRGQFGKTRKMEERAFYQKDSEPLHYKPQFFLTFNAVQTLIYLRGLVHDYDRLKKTGLKHYVEVLRRYSGKIDRSLSLAGDFAERLLLKHGGQIEMQAEGYFNGSFVSYRHTIGAAIVLLLLNRQPTLVDDVITRLVRGKVQKRDGGWPIANRIYTSSDVLCSTHVAFLLHLALKRQCSEEARSEIRSKLDATVAFLIVASHKHGGYWTYEKEDDRVPFSARTYPELFNILAEYGFDLLYDMPRRLFECWPVDPNTRFGDQLAVRLAYVFRMVAYKQPVPFLEKYLEIRRHVLDNYSAERYYSSFEMCCLVVMMLDRMELPLSEKAEIAWILTEPIIEELYFVGSTYRVTKEMRSRLKRLKLWD